MPAAACAGKTPDVAYFPMRRLTRQQYQRVTADLLKVTTTVPAVDLPSDELIGSYVSNARSPLTELHVQQYMDAAELLASAAVAKVDALVGCSAGTASCARDFVVKFGERAFRRSLTDAEVNQFATLHGQIAASQTFADGIRVVIQAMLQSPQFLYRMELGDGSGEVVALNDRELAHRLSFFLWDGLPDSALLADATLGKLKVPGTLATHARRMLKDGKAHSVMKRFAAQWLNVSDLPGVTKDKKIYPAYTQSLMETMVEETSRFFEQVLYVDDGRLQTLLTAPYSMLSGGLHAHYGLPAPAGGTTAWTKTDLNPAQRAGVLTQGSVLSMHAHIDQTSPVHRGVLVRTEFLCQQLTPPPPTVDDTPPPLEAGLTTRQRLERKTAPGECAGCHRLINPVGFGLENYDGIGKYRTKEEGQTVDASGELVGTQGIDGRFTGGVELAKRLAGSIEVHQCVATQVFRFAMGRLEAAQDACSVDALRVALGPQGDVKELMVAIASMDAFRLRRVQ